MQVFDAIRTLLAVREYQDRPIPGDVVDRILEAARLTASASNRQHWDFVVVRDKETLRAIGQRASSGGYIANAPMAIAVLVPDSPLGYIDGARAAQDMMLAAWDAGVGSVWVGNVNTPELRSLLNVPNGRMILTIIPFGYPVKKLGAGRKARKPLNEIAHQEQFGRPYARQSA
ncbi:MAG TPA: nitroreductase family protein [Caldilineaceae bacterium]|nr:nitroreductase family protein [Caldilineaceae bacterium]